METIGFALLFPALAWLCFRLWPDDRDRWHTDPADTSEAHRSAVRLIGQEAPRFPCDAETVLEVMSAIAVNEPGTRFLDGSIEEGMMTFVTSSPFGFRDYTTIKAVDEPGRSKLAIHARSRLSWPDRGSNTARLDRWLLEAEQTLGRREH